jgi:hypothetical protein
MLGGSAGTIPAMTLDPRLGLCAGCRHSRTIRTRTGSEFLLCERSHDDPRYPRYPRLPVLTCPGFEAVSSEGDASPGRTEPPG